MSKKTLTNFEAINALNAISALDSESFSTKVAFRLASWAKTLGTAIEPYEEQRKKITDKYTKKDKDGNPEQPKDEDGKPIEGRIMLTDSSKFNDEMTKLANEELSIQFLARLSLEDLDKEDVKLSPSKLLPLLPLVEEEKDA